ncbi:MAG TPA: AAA family ATPase [Kineosporiaceae bacterium]|nr:AAA family ATPase [Kineosporiaceae bacterium]
MRVTEVRLEGIRGFPAGGHSVSLSFNKAPEPPRWIVLAGRNGSGKSTFLQALALAIAGPSVARLLAETFTGWIRDGEDRALAAARLAFGDEDGFAAGRKPTFDPWTAIEWTRTDGPEPLMDRIAVGGNWTPQRGPWAENPRGWFIAGYGPFRRISPAPTEAQRLMMSPGRPAALASLFREDASLSESIVWLQQVYLRRLEKKQEAEELEHLVLRLLSDGLLPEEMTVDHVDSEGLWVTTPDGGRLALRSLSDGYRVVAGLVLDLIKQLAANFGSVALTETADGHVQVLHSGVVLIDEVDVHLHVEWQKRIGFWLKSHFPNVQFIVTTHSPFICQAADVGGLVRLSPRWTEGPIAEVLTGEAFNRVVNGSADDAVMSELFGLDTAFSDTSVNVRNRLAELEAVAVARTLTASELEEVESLRTDLPTSQAEIAVRSLMRARLVER